jgi:hypothetical protein
MCKVVCQTCTAGRKQSSPLVFALIVAVFGTAGGLILANAEEVSRTALVDKSCTSMCCAHLLLQEWCAGM